MNMDTPMTAVQTPAPLCFAKLFKTAFDGQDLKSLRDRLITQSRSNPVDAASALLSLSTIEQLLDDQPSGLQRQAEALSLHRLYRSSWPASPNALRVVAFKAAGEIAINTPIEFLLEGADVVLYSLYVMPGLPLPEVPDHDIAIVTVGESDGNRPVIEEIEQLVQTWPCPVLNRPDRAFQLTREGMYRLLKGIPGLVMPATVRIDRASFEKLGRGLLPVSEFLPDAAFPLIARPIGSHGGRGLVKLDSALAISPYLAGRPQVEFSISPYVGYCSPDGQFRKYRIFWVDGRPYLATWRSPINGKSGTTTPTWRTARPSERKRNNSCPPLTRVSHAATPQPYPPWPGRLASSMSASIAQSCRTAGYSCSRGAFAWQSMTSTHRISIPIKAPRCRNLSRLSWTC